MSNLLERGDLILIGMFLVLFWVTCRGTEDGRDPFDDSWQPTLKDKDGTLPHETKGSGYR